MRSKKRLYKAVLPEVTSVSAVLYKACYVLQQWENGATNVIHSSTPSLREFVLQLLNKFIYVIANAGLWLR